MTADPIDLRPDSVDLLIRPDTTVTLTLEWEPSGVLDGRSFSSTLDGQPLGLSVSGDTMTIEASTAVTSTLTAGTPVQWQLVEDLGGTTEPVLLGTWTPSTAPSATDAKTVTVTQGAATITLQAQGSTASILAVANDLSTHENDLGAHAGGRAPVIVVAASDAPQAVKDSADHVCDGVDDEATIEAAAGSGDVTVLLSPGTFRITAENRGVALPTRTTLQGSGRQVTFLELQPADLSDTGTFDPNLSWGVISVEGTEATPREDVTVRDLTIDGNKANMTGSGNANQGEGVDFEQCRQALAHNVEVRDTPADGIDLDFSDGTVSDCWAISTGGSGVHLSGGFPVGDPLTATRWAIVTNLHAVGCGSEHLRAGFDVTADSGNAVIDGAMCRDGLLGWTVSGQQVTVANVQEHNNAAAAEFRPASARSRAIGCRFDAVPLNNGTATRFVQCYTADASSDERGTATIADGSSTATVPHGLWAEPAAVTATPRAGEPVWISARTATDITIERSGTSGALDVDWTANL